MGNNRSLTNNGLEDMALVAFIGETSSELAGRIGESLKAAGMKIHVFSSMDDLVENTEKTLPDILLLNPKLVTNGVAAKVLYPKTPTMIYSSQMDADQRLDFYSQGVKRVIVEPEDLAERVASAAGMMIYRRNDMRMARLQSLTHGTVKAFSLQEVLQNALLEEKNLILKIKNDDWDAKLRLFQGHIVNAYTANLSNEAAVLKTLQLSKGSFVIRGYQKLEEFSPMSASTLAILAETKFEKKYTRHFLELRCNGVDNPEFETVAAGLEGALSDEQNKIMLQLIERYRNFQDILLHSPYAILKSLRVLDRLSEMGAIAPAGEQPAPPRESFRESFSESDIEFLRSLFPENAKVGSLAVLGAPTSGRSELIRAVAGFQQSTVKTVKSVDFARIPIRKDTILTLFGVSIEEAFLPILEKISESLIGCIFLIDCSNPGTFEFINYLASRIIQIYEVPFAVGLTNTGDDVEAALKMYRQHFTLPGDIPVIPVQADKFSDAKALLYQLKHEDDELEEDSEEV